MKKPLRHLLFSHPSFTPRVIFSALQGAWYEAGLNGTLFTDASGTTPASAESTVELALDKSQGLVLGPELVSPINFYTWTPVGSGSPTVISNTSFSVAGTANGFSKSIGFVTGRVYKIIVNATSGALYGIYNSNSSSTPLLTNISSGITTLLFTATSQFLYFRMQGVGTFTVDSITCTEVLGNHATQSTAANRPILKNSGNTWFLRHDATDVLVASLPAINVRRNLLTNSVWDGAVAGTPGTNPTGWSTGSTTGSLGTPYPSNSGDRIIPFIVSNTRRSLRFTYAAAANTTYAVSITVVRNPNNFTFAGFFTVSSSPAGTTTTAFLANGSPVTSAYAPLAGDRVTRIITTSSTAGNLSVDFGAGTSANATGTIELTQPQFELGSVATPYQRVTDWTSEAFSSAGSTYFATPVGMSAIHNQPIGQSYSLPALSSDIYGSIVVPERLSAAREAQLAVYMQRLAGIAGPEYFEQVDYGPELVTNGDFEQGDTWWAKGAATTITQVSGNWAARVSNASNGTSQLYKINTLTIGNVYTCTFTILNYVSGQIRMILNTGTIITPVSGGSYSITFTANSTTFGFTTLNAGATFDIDNVSCRELKDGMTGQLTADDGTELILAQ